MDQIEWRERREGNLGILTKRRLCYQPIKENVYREKHLVGYRFSQADLFITLMLSIFFCPKNILVLGRESHILEPFFLKKELGRSGTGLGLTIVWNTMQDHDGGIRVISTEKGSTFELYFPSAPDGLEITPQKAINVPMENGQKILIVDDEFQQRDIATRLLEFFGYNVESVASAMSAIDYVRENQVDLVLLDMILESEMNGLETFEELIKICPNQKAIILSGFSESDDVKNTIRMGAGGLVNKPYTREQLTRSVFNELEKD